MRQRGKAGWDQPRWEIEGESRSGGSPVPVPGDLVPPAYPCILCVSSKNPSDMSQSSPFYLQFFRGAFWAFANQSTRVDNPPPTFCSLLLIYQHLNTAQSPTPSSLHSSVASACIPLSNSNNKTRFTRLLRGVACCDLTLPPIPWTKWADFLPWFPSPSDDL